MSWYTFYSSLLNKLINYLAVFSHKLYNVYTNRLEIHHMFLRSTPFIVINVVNSSDKLFFNAYAKTSYGTTEVRYF